MKMNLDTTEVLGSDATPPMTGWKGGSLAHFQRMLHRALFLAICLIHHLELPLKHLIEKIDGKPTGKYTTFVFYTFIKKHYNLFTFKANKRAHSIEQ